MATILQTDRQSGVARHRTRPHDRFYLWQTLVCAAIAIGGFLPTYWLQLAPRSFIGPPLLHIHGALCTLWIFFLVSQASLIVRGKRRNHRDWGLAGIALATAVIIVGISAAIVSLKFELGRGLGDASRSFLVVPLAAMARFAIFTGAAIGFTHQSDWHKRFMIVGTVGLIEAAAARIAFTFAVGYGPGLRPGLLPPPPATIPIAVGLLLQLIIIAGMVHDRRTRGSVHPAWTIGLIGSVAVILLKVPLSTTAGWLAFADWTTRIAG